MQAGKGLRRYKGPRGKAKMLDINIVGLTPLLKQILKLLKTLVWLLAIGGGLVGGAFLAWAYGALSQFRYGGG